MSTKNGKAKVKLAVIIIASILILTLTPTLIYCGVKQINPVEVVSSAFTSNNPELLIGKWQNESRSSAYEFYDNGSYDSYFSTFSFTGDYTVKGNELTLSNPASDSTVVYKFSVDKKKLTLSLDKENGLDSENEQVVEYTRVDRIEMKSLTDLLGDIVDSASEESEDNTANEEQ